MYEYSYHTISFAAMQVHYFENGLPQFTNAVLTIGTFDGVHQGHQQVLQQLTDTAKKIQGESVLITFHPHPRLVLKQTYQPIQTLTTLEEKLALLKFYGVQHVVVVNFTEAFGNLTPAEYIEQFLVQNFRPHTIIIGYDHRFGANREGNFTLLQEKAAQFGYQVQQIAEHILRSITISSTQIRAALLDGNIHTATELMAHKYTLIGKVVKGHQLGRTIGFATANIAVTDTHKLVPGNGVYAVTVCLPKHENPTTFTAMMNIGVRPTVQGTNRTIEVHILNFDGDIYNEELQVTFHHKIRDEQKFANLEALQQQLQHDKQTVEAYFAN